MANPRLEAMRAVMLGQAPEPVVSASPSAAKMISQLRIALATERKARIAAEARLRAVLAEVGRQTWPAARQMEVEMVETPLLPESTEPEVIEPTEIIEPVDARSAIMDLGGDEFDEEDNDA